ncbi:hypothetical protein NCAS_0B05650 [Naumovozyma castellii]|uniref:Uncharacterized protein n=1 Tax=Naumovozyma castellii TaxID=27288 RepID=G0V9N3_NAUCA|nr:hypothetical protein NCAS_0B05650 [Naumovozyma castellii CBS 4309]CCC68649.1 hypothetical protein NCAS_0B05650 [Naumovozyma castellii CBS 4309]
MSLTQDEESDTSILSQIHNLSYDGKEDAFFFCNDVRNLITRPHQNSISIPDVVICEILLQGLKGPYKTLQSKYALGESNKNISSILQDIQWLYHLHGTSSVVPSTKSGSATSSKTNVAHDKGKHENKGPTTSSTTKKSGSTSKTFKKASPPKKRLEKAQNISSDYQHPPPPSNDGYELRPPSTVNEVILRPSSKLTDANSKPQPSLSDYDNTDAEDYPSLPGHLLLNTGSSTSLIHYSDLLHNMKRTTDTMVPDAQSRPIPFQASGSLVLNFKHKNSIAVRAVLTKWLHMIC